MVYVHLFLLSITKALRNKLNYSIFPKSVYAFVRFVPCKEQSNKWIWDRFNWDRFSDLGWIHFHVHFSNIQTVVSIYSFLFLCTLLLLLSAYWPFSLGNLKKKILQQIQSYEDVPFLGPKWSICPKQWFFQKIIKITLIYLLATFIVQNF